MQIKPFFPVFIAIVGVVVYVHYNAEKVPERPSTATPKEYIELVEKSKRERIQQRDAELEEEKEKMAEDAPKPPN
ncbi:MAG: aldehyde dehydrogenase [Sedimenticola sp.]